MTRLEALEAVASDLRSWCLKRAELDGAGSTTDDTQALFDALDALPAAPAPAQGEAVEVAVWRLPGGEVRFLEVGSYDDVNRTYENPWNAWRRGGTARLPIRATVATEGGGE